jgi:hypothetical protein
MNPGFSPAVFFLIREPRASRNLGERGRIRTCDPCLKRALLYQLSYAPTVHSYYTCGNNYDRAATVGKPRPERMVAPGGTCFHNAQVHY